MRGPRKTVKASSMQRRLCQTGLADAPKVELVLRPLRPRLMLLRCPTDAAQSNGRHSRGTAGGRRRGRRRLRAAGLQALPNSGWATRIRTLADGFGAGLSAAELRDLYVQRGGEVFPPFAENRLGRLRSWWRDIRMAARTHCAAITPPPSALRVTTSQGGVCQTPRFFSGLRVC